MIINQAIHLLQREGYKVTERRKVILEFFKMEKNKYKTARDLYKHMKKRYPGISYDTVYRNLHLYHKLNILESTHLNTEKHFRLTGSTSHYHHFICKTCGVAEKINFCPMDYVRNTLANFTIDDHKFEVYGQCPACRAS